VPETVAPAAGAVSETAGWVVSQAAVDAVMVVRGELLPAASRASRPIWYVAEQERLSTVCVVSVVVP
jgi:hypothetical protein